MPHSPTGLTAHLSAADQAIRDSPFLQESYGQDQSCVQAVFLFRRSGGGYDVFRIRPKFAVPRNQSLGAMHEQSAQESPLSRRYL